MLNDDILDEIENLIQSSLYASYCFNRTRSPEIPVKHWTWIYRRAEEYEILYQKERELHDSQREKSKEDKG